jgi:hypothetical protein
MAVAEECGAVRLSKHESFMAAVVGVTRHVASQEYDTSSRHHGRDYGWHSDIEGACAELALAKWLDVFWDGSVNTFKAPDVGAFQVRHTQHLAGHLILKENDSEDEAFVLVTGTNPSFTIRGYMFARDGMQDQYRREHMGEGVNGDARIFSGWWIPQADLSPAEGLKP